MNVAGKVLENRCAVFKPYQSSKADDSLPNHPLYSIFLSAPRKTFSLDELLARNIEALIWHFIDRWSPLG
jgi:hypothetical protein